MSLGSYHLLLLVMLCGTALSALPPGNASLQFLRLGGDDDGNNITLVKETVVHIQVTPPEEEEEQLDLAGVYMHQATSGIQAILKSGSKMLLDPFVKFFQALFSHVHRPEPSNDRRKLYII